MAYIGNQPTEAFTTFATQTFSTSATSSYTLDHAVTNENERVLDGWMVGTASGGGTSLNVQQQHGNPTGAPYGYASSMKMTVAVADDGGSDSFNVVQARMENLDTN